MRPSLPDDERDALEKALAAAGMTFDGMPEHHGSAWRRAAAQEAVDGEPFSDDYALSPRSTRGATRA